MKRALAERAKQSLPPLSSSARSSANDNHQHNNRRGSGVNATTSSSNSSVGVLSPSAPPAKLARKASAPPSISQQVQDDDTTNSQQRPHTISKSEISVVDALQALSSGVGLISSPNAVTSNNQSSSNSSQRDKHSSSSFVPESDPSKSVVVAAPAVTVPVPTKSNSLSTPTATSSSSTAAATAPSSAGHKRQRVDLEVPNEASAFYLQHQNRALALECQSLRFENRQLLAERDQRRQDCWAASQALHSLQATWTQLETVLTGQSQVRIRNHCSTVTAADTESQKQLPSTGTGNSVEWTKALSDALASLGALGTKNKISFGNHATKESEMDCDDDDDDDDENDDESPNTTVVADWSKCAANLSARAQILQERLWPVVKTADRSLLSASHFQKQTVEAQGKSRLLQSRVDELVAAREAVVTKERRTRRAVYRLAVGIITKEQLVKALETDDDDDIHIQRQVMQEAELLKPEKNEPCLSSTNAINSPSPSSAGANFGKNMSGNAAVPSDQVEAFQNKLKDLEQAISNRDKEIGELVDKIREKEERITQLTARQLSDEDVKQLQAFSATKEQLMTAQTAVQILQEKVKSLEKSWAEALANEQAAVELTNQQNDKFKRRWAEVTTSILSIATATETSQPGESDHSKDDTNNKTKHGQVNGVKLGMDRKFDISVTGVSDMTMAALHAQQEHQAKKIVELRHKLDQAVENVRQAETTRQDLKDALNLNKSLQLKLEELKNRLSSATSMQVENSSSTGNNSGQHHRQSSSDGNNGNDNGSSRDNSGVPPSSSSLQGSGSSTPSTEKYEKLQREHRRMRKELAAFAASKESAKAKLERAEKERDNLLETNSRLLSQITEKDEMNAKSLSTILHLKSLTEKLSSERDNLEQQAKSASQLALAARLATNAKERVSEEILKEKRSLEDKLAELEDKLAQTSKELSERTKEWSEASGKMTTQNTELSNAFDRCNELVLEIEKKDEKIRTLMDDIARADREAQDANEKFKRVSKGGSTSFISVIGGGDNSTAASSTASSFTVDQLQTQISVLKNRLACPVCHYRDKECIIMKCRHMHCKQCVQDCVNSRSRKCPTCAMKFAENQVEDIWLN